VDCNDGNICTADSCNPSLGCVYGTSGSCAVSGTVLYYRNSAGGGAEPSSKPVPNMSIDADQNALADATTGSAGTYSVPNLFGSFQVQAMDRYGNPRAADDNGAISSFDAANIARHAVHLITLSTNQQIAGDVTGNGQVTSTDASFVAQFASHVIDHFPVAVSDNSDWRFLRCDTYQDATNQTCGAPVYQHNPLSGSATDNFYAVLYGDVTGNWGPSSFASSAQSGSGTSSDELAAISRDAAAADRLGGRTATPPRLARRSNPASLSLKGWSSPLKVGQRRVLQVNVQKADGIVGLDLNLTYDQSRISIVEIQTSGLGSAMTVLTNDETGSVRIAAYGVVPLVGSGSIMTITVEALADTGSRIPLSIDGSANEGGIPLRTAGQGSVPTRRSTRGEAGKRD
jgi:hypothetical protein